jgi:AcrR family transcriptional regulator
MIAVEPQVEETEAVLDAAAACYLRFGVAKTTAADIAKEAGTSRATLYRRHGTHEQILLAVLTRESQAMFQDAEARLDGLDLRDPIARTIEGMVFVIGEIQRRPVHRAIFTTEAAAWAATQAVRLSAMRRLTETGIRPALAFALEQGTLTEQQLDDLVEWILRILISYAAVPGHEGLDTDDIRRQLDAGLRPALQGLFGPSTQGGTT